MRAYRRSGRANRGLLRDHPPDQQGGDLVLDFPEHLLRDLKRQTEGPAEDLRWRDRRFRRLDGMIVHATASSRDGCSICYRSCLLSSLLTFLIASLLPGDLAYVILGDQATPENVAALRHDMGLDQPIWWRYLGWLGHVLQGDFGRSFRTGQTVLQAVAERLPVSIELMLLAEITGLVIGVPLAIACAVRAGGAFDRFMTGTAFGMLSVPTFLSAILLIYLFAVELHLAAGNRLRAVRGRPGRQPALHGAAGADLGARRMAGDHARAALRHDRNPAGGLYRARQGEGTEAARASCSCMP